MKKILLLCSAGMSTSMVVKKMEAAAAAENIEVKIAAASLDQFSSYKERGEIFTQLALRE